ncbi:MAG: DUF1003 domain-containing protein [Nanoarchaeota archaeon]|nr:DUF1003 domain-containing protein [Nanoarchaeota archaeon]
MFKKEEDHFKKSIVVTHPASLPTTKGERAADKLTKVAGSWGFIGIFAIFLILWMITNVIWLAHRSWDPYPFILLNLVLSCIAAIQAPIILMSQNRSNERDRQRAEYDYAVNRKSERGIEEIKKLLEKIEKKRK